MSLYQSSDYFAHHDPDSRQSRVDRAANQVAFSGDIWDQALSDAKIDEMDSDDTEADVAQ